MYLDTHVESKAWQDAVPDMFPDHVVLTADGTYPN
jgi:hypothetical protein